MEGTNFLSGTLFLTSLLALVFGSILVFWIYTSLGLHATVVAIVVIGLSFTIGFILGHKNRSEM